MADIDTALVAFLGVLAGSYLNNFVAEDFRRFRDSQALAGALAGELESHASAIPLVRQRLADMDSHVKRGDKLNLQEWPQPSSPVFDANVGKIGLMPPTLAGEVAYVYEQIRAFRFAFHQLSKYSKDTDQNWVLAMINNCNDRITCAHDKGIPLVEKLKRHASGSYWRDHVGWKICSSVLATLFVGIGIVAYGATASGHSIQCAATFDNRVLHATCK